MPQYQIFSYSLLLFGKFIFLCYVTLTWMELFTQDFYLYIVTEEFVFYLGVFVIAIKIYFIYLQTIAYSICLY